MHFLTEYFSENRYQTQRLCIIMGFGKRENTFDWRIYMKKVPIKELREDLKEELKEELVSDSEILDKQTMGEEMYHKLEIRRDVKDSIVVIIASILYAINVNVFVNAGNLLPGGATGISLLLQHICRTFLHISVPYSLFSILLNAVPATICYRVVGKKYTLRSVLCIFVMSIAVDMIPSHFITDDLLLIAIFGGIINGVLIALILNSHATSGGTDFISMIISKKKGISVWNYIFMGNVAVLLIAGCIYGMNVALYSIIFQYASTQMINMMYKRYDKDTLFIITKKPDEVYNIILKKTNHDATLFKGVGCYKNEGKAMLYSVVNSDATRVVIMDIKKEDPDAFINYFGSKGIRGKFYYQEEE